MAGSTNWAGAEETCWSAGVALPDAAHRSLPLRRHMPDPWREWAFASLHRPAPLPPQAAALAFTRWRPEQFDLRGHDVVLSNKSGFATA